MKISKFLFVLSISFSFGNIFADDFECQKLEGQIQLIPAPKGCPILTKQAKWFPDLIFLFNPEIKDPPTCFVGRVEGTLGDTPIIGKVASGLTLNTLGLDPGTFLTAASAIRIHDAETDRKLGKVFTKDSILVAQAREYLVLTEGTRRFKGAEGHVEIFGNVFFPGGAELTGTLCLED